MFKNLKLLRKQNQSDYLIRLELVTIKKNRSFRRKMPMLKYNNRMKGWTRTHAEVK